MTTTNTYGRQVVIPLTNKSGGGIIAGDVVIVDTSNNGAFTTTTTGAFTGGIGVAQETIASNAVGRVLLSGYAALINTNASVTRGNFGKTHTVVKQATDAGSSRIAGTFCQFLTGGTTPDAIVYPSDLGGTALTNPMSAVGDIIQGTTAGAPQALAAPLTGKVLTGAGLTTSVGYKYPPGYEFDYAENTSPVTITHTSEATADTIVTGNAVTYDGSTIVLIEMNVTDWLINSSTPGDLAIPVLYDGSSSIGLIALTPAQVNAVTTRMTVRAARRLTPSNASHTYSIRGYKSAGGSTVQANSGAGGAAATMPSWIRITKVSGGA